MNKRKSGIKIEEKSVYTKLTKDDLIPVGKQKHEL